MKNNEAFIQEALNGFQTNKGKARITCFKPFKYIDLISAFIQKYRIRRPEDCILIIIPNNAMKVAITQALIVNKLYYKVFVTNSDIKNTSYNITFAMLINVDDINIIKKYTYYNKFTLYINTDVIYDTTLICELNKLLPEIKTTITSTNIMTSLLSSPVEEIRLGVGLNDEDRTKYSKCEEYIKDSMCIFGDLSNVNKCRIGDINAGISAADFRQNLAYNNGWNNTLDTSIPIYKSIDDNYNPNALYERANIVYNIIRERLDLVTSNPLKLEKIGEIVRSNPNKQILVVSKKGEFATKISEYINDNECGNCGEYHDCIEPTYIKDADGNIICYKSGENKGKYKVFGSQALSNHYLEAFNNKILNVLSIKNSSSNKLKTAIDAVILTSPFCLDYEELVNRFTDVTFSYPLRIYKIYCQDTIESKELGRQIPKPNVKLVDEQIKVNIINEIDDSIL